jgi:excisionase family DNA binding protein
MAVRRAHREPGRPAGKSGLPAPIVGEPFSLIGTLRRTRTTLTVEDAAELLQCTKKTIYKYINSGLIPVADLGFDLIRIDPKQWVESLERKNPHLARSARSLSRAA